VGTTQTTKDMYPSRVKSRPEILERQDPVLHTDGTSGPLAKEQAAFYRDNGYLYLEEFFTPEETEKLRKELKSIWEEGSHANRPEVIREPSSNTVRSVFAVHRDNAVFQALAKSDKLRDIVRQMLGSDVYIHQSRINFKPGFTGKEFYWHSDFETWHVEDGMPRMRALSCSIALEDNFHYNGPLMVIPGSQNHYVACVGETPDENYKNSLRKQEYGTPDDESMKWLVEQGGIDTPTGKKGSVLFFDCNIMHGSNSNISPFPRSNVFFVFNSVDNQLVEPFSGKKPRPEYIAHRDTII